jgi:multidrug efflux pump subunit AcrA (membrane-fusion protein)
VSEVPVEIGHRSALQAEVLSGLTVGDQVIVHPPTNINADATITVRNES